MAENPFYVLQPHRPPMSLHVGIWHQVIEAYEIYEFPLLRWTSSWCRIAVYLQHWPINYNTAIDWIDSRVRYI